MGIGPITFFQLLARYGSAAEAIAALPEIEAQSRKALSLASRKTVSAEMEKTLSVGAQMIAAAEPGFPQSLRAIADTPPMISVRGPLSLSNRSIAIVGARNASAVGKRMASTLARDLGAEGVVIVSGLARGIDGAAHMAAIESGTIAVLAGGIDQVYPPEHKDLYRSISEQGAIVSEVRFGQVAKAQDFPKRNRIVSGLSSGVIVVEAAERSGTLITARLGSEQGRDVYAVPGSPLDPRSAGTNRLIRQGATLIRHADDVLEGMSTFAGIAEPDPLDFASEDAPASDDDRRVLRKELLSLLSYTPIHRDALLRETSAPLSHVADTLLDLLLEGVVDEVSGGSFVLSASTDASLSSV